MGNWLTDAGDYLGSGLEALGGLFGGSDTPTPTTTAPTNGGGDGLFSNGKFLGSVLDAGLGLAKTYFSQADQKRLAEQYAEQRRAELELQAKLAAKGGGGPDRAGQLSQLYQNWAALKQRAGESEGQLAQSAGQMIQDPIIARLGRL